MVTAVFQMREDNKCNLCCVERTNHNFLNILVWKTNLIYSNTLPTPHAGKKPNLYLIFF